MIWMTKRISAKAVMATMINVSLRSATEVVAIGSIGQTPTNRPVRGGANESVRMDIKDNW